MPRSNLILAARSFNDFGMLSAMLSGSAVLWLCSQDFTVEGLVMGVEESEGVEAACKEMARDRSWAAASRRRRTMCTPHFLRWRSIDRVGAGCAAR